VTNNHVVDGADKVEVTTDTARPIPQGDRHRSAHRSCPDQGRGWLKLPVARLSDSKPRIGDWVLAVGNPFGLGGPVTAGIRVRLRPPISQSARMTTSFQIDAPVNKGNSGGPAFDVQDAVVTVESGRHHCDSIRLSRS